MEDDLKGVTQLHGKLRINISIIIILALSFIGAAWGWIAPDQAMAASASALSIFPTEGSREGGESVVIQGGPFTNSTITVTRPTGATGGTYDITLPIVVAKDWDNLKDPADNALLTNKPWPQVDLPGGITVILKNNLVQVSIVKAGVTYQASYAYNLGTPIYINTGDLVSSNGFYPYAELIKISDDSTSAAAGSQYLYAEAGYARWASIRSDNPKIIDLKTPAYYTAGSVQIEIRNNIAVATSEAFTGTFTYYTPVSNPQITNVLREGQAISTEVVNGSTIKPVKVNYKGGNTVTIAGTDFRENLTVKIGDLYTVAASAINTEISGQISFVVPTATTDVIGRLLTLQVLNADGGLALSTELNPPVYLQYTKGDITPSITKVSPAMGFACGGGKITIEGKNFRQEGEIAGYSGKLMVSFGGVKVPDSDLSFVDDKKLVVTVPSNTAGSKNLVVENPDGELAVLSSGYTCISMPVITGIQITNANVTNSINQVSLSGGQEVIIKGTGFMTGAKIVFGAGEPQIISASSTSASFIYLPRDTNLDLTYNRFTYQGGTEWPVVFVDSRTLKVTVPAGQLSGSGIMVVNSDLGASELYKDISYTIEELPTVTNVKAELCNDQAIKIHWSAVAGATYYEVYFEADGDDPEILGTTKDNSMVFEKYSNRTSYRFQVKARNDSGVSLASGYSNQIFAYQHGREDNDGAISQKTTTSRLGSQALVNIGQADNDSGLLTVNLQKELVGVKETVIAIPAGLIRGSQSKDIQVIGPDFRLKFNTRVFRKEMSSSELTGFDNGVRFRLAVAATPGEKGITVVSQAYNLTAYAYTGSEQRLLENLDGNIQLDLYSNPAKTKLANTQNMRLVRWQDSRDGAKHEWVNTGGNIDASAGKGSFNINRLGIYAIIADRR